MKCDKCENNLYFETSTANQLLMIWTSIFIISVAQGLFLISLVLLKGSKNPIASRLIITLLALMILTNWGYLVVRTDLADSIPQFFAVPLGMIFLFGPLLFFYSRSIIESDFRWKHIYWLHFIPYLIQVYFNLPLLFAQPEMWKIFNQAFLSGNLPVRAEEKIIFAIQDIHLFAYLFITYRWIQSAKTKLNGAGLIVSIPERIKWLKELNACFLVFLVMVFALYLVVLFHGYYNPVTNYTYTIVISVVIYFIAYKLVLNPGLISPGFEKKYKAYMQFSGVDGEKYISKLESLMKENKIFTDPELKLASLSKEIGLPSHQVSKLINEKFGKTFTELVNEYRVAEFIKRLSDGQDQALTIYGIAMEVGFNSKSSFNAAFKKITGKTPSEYKNQ